MNTAIRTKYHYSPTPKTDSHPHLGFNYSLYGLLGGMGALILGAIAGVPALFLIGFGAIAFSVIVIKSLFWDDATGGQDIEKMMRHFPDGDV